ncbi:MAG: hypothetical protein U0900_13995 [Myxococcota bacterium]
MSTGPATGGAGRVLALVQTVLTIAYPLLIVWALSRFPPRVVALVLLALLGVRAVVVVLRRRGAPGAMGQQVPWSLALPVALVAAVSAATAVVNDPLGLLLAPVFVNAALFTAFALSLRSEPIVETLARLQVDRLAPAERRYCRRVTLVWCGFFVLNGAISFALAWTRSLDAWALYTGLLSYCLMGLLFAGEYLYRHVRFRRYVGGPADRLLARLLPPLQTPERTGVVLLDGGRVRSVRLEVPTGLACWRGHFPGQPMLPGVVQVDWVLRELADWLGEAPPLRAIEGLKFKQPVLPGDELELELERAGEGALAGADEGASADRGRAVDFRFLRDGEEVSRGRVCFGSPGTGPGLRAVEAVGSGSGGASQAPSWPAPAELLIHADPMVWLRRVEAHDERETRCLVSVDDLGGFRDAAGGVGAHVALEWMAQAVAAHAGLERRARGEAPCLGLLLGSKHVGFARSAYTRGEQLRVVVVRGWGGERGPSSFDCHVEGLEGGVRVAEARLSCFVPEQAAVDGLARDGIGVEATPGAAKGKRA